jgi:hypothetical protein
MTELRGPAFGGDEAAARQRLEAPAILLMVLGGASVAFSGLSIVGNLLSGAMNLAFLPMSGDDDAAAWIVGMLSGGLGVGFSFLNLMMSALIVYGGLEMRAARSYPVAVIAAVIALIPCTSPTCCCFGMPAGIWALIVLLDAQVQRVFR